MSDPVSNAEIEDVLSSIRRLVSGESEALNSADDAQETPKKPVAKLVLTADFRVPDQDEETSDNLPETDDGQISDPPESDCVEAVMEFNGAEQKQPDEAANEDQAPDIEATDEAQVFDTDDEEPVEEMTLADKIADLEAAVGNQEGQWEPDGSDFQEDADAEQVLTQPVQQWIDSTAHEVEPPLVDEDIVEAVTAATDTQDTADQADGDDSFETADGVIDEETLRDMVSEIVRQELQGALGERITRNVRKLVRREINRTIAAQDFD